MKGMFSRRRGSRAGDLFVEEVLLIGIAMAILVALVSLISGLFGNTVNGIMHLQNTVNGALNGFINDLQRVLSNAFNLTG
ncbi:hypothetical protein [Vulcanisaeta thermophila]|uniref:hypothetical protein n=1 Tax=Vulcanisaeta thermophila TaxID=867917 RepID=UPI000B186A70|nr:hypothetical protein [Vulcanisaeta thermophila]